MQTFLFPGQGSQSKGMGESLFDEFEELTNKADEILGYSIRELCVDDPENVLNQTQFTQPALYVVNALSYFKRIEETGQKPDFVAGHSLGEFNALLAAECFSFETGLKLVRKRGELMSQATGGGMAAVLNATQNEIESILKENELTGIDLANYNSPSQIVISGLKEEIEKAQPFFQHGNILFIPLKTSGAFHSRYMQSARQEFETFLNEVEFSDLTIPVISNVSARPYKNDEIIKNLSSQITSSVRWSDSIRYLMGLGEMEFEEIGHGEVLTKLVRKIQAEAPRPSRDSSDELSETEASTEVSLREEETNRSMDNTDEKKESEGTSLLNADEKVAAWNQNHPIGTRVKSTLIEDDNLETRTEAVVLFGHRAAVYMKGYNGYFDLDEIAPL